MCIFGLYCVRGFPTVYSQQALNRNWSLIDLTISPRQSPRWEVYFPLLYSSLLTPLINPLKGSCQSNRSVVHSGIRSWEMEHRPVTELSAPGTGTVQCNVILEGLECSICSEINQIRFLKTRWFLHPVINALQAMSLPSCLGDCVSDALGLSCSRN